MGQEFSSPETVLEVRENIVCSVDCYSVISTVQGTHAAVAAFFMPARYTRKI